MKPYSSSVWSANLSMVRLVATPAKTAQQKKAKSKSKGCSELKKGKYTPLIFVLCSWPKSLIIISALENQKEEVETLPRVAVISIVLSVIMSIIFVLILLGCCCKKHLVCNGEDEDEGQMARRLTGSAKRKKEEEDNGAKMNNGRRKKGRRGRTMVVHMHSCWFSW